MSKYMRTEHKPVVLSEILYSFILNIPNIVNIPRSFYIYIRNSKYIYTKHLVGIVLKILHILPNQSLNIYHKIYNSTNFTRNLFENIVEKFDYEWNIIYDNKSDRKLLNKEVTISNMLKHSEEFIIQNFIIINSNSLSSFVDFLDNETLYLNNIYNFIKHSNKNYNISFKYYPPQISNTYNNNKVKNEDFKLFEDTEFLEILKDIDDDDVECFRYYGKSKFEHAKYLYSISDTDFF